MLLVLDLVSKGPKTLLQKLVTSEVQEAFFYLIISEMVRQLLLLSGDIEVNPGPLTQEELTRGPATLITDAPEGVKPVLSVWAPEKSEMVSEWNSSKFTVPILKEALAWLRNTTTEDLAKQKKVDLARALPVHIGPK